MLARVGHHRGWLMAFGVITFLAGIVVLAWPGLIVLAYPGISLLTLAIVLGVWMPVFGAMETTLAVRAMSFRRHHAGTPTTAHAM